MKTKLAALFCALTLILLSGCSLAVADAGETSEQDMLVGFFITTDYLDLFDYEAYLNDNAEDMFDGGEMDPTGYEQRLYAQKTGEGEHGECSFGVEGYSFFLIKSTDGESNSTCVHVEGGAIAEPFSSLGGDDERIEGTLYYDCSQIAAFYYNPVYQTATGEIYAMTGDGVSFSGDGSGWFTKTIEESYKVTEDGETREHSFKAELLVKPLPSRDRVVLKQFGSGDRLLSETELTAGTKSVEKAPGVEYYIVENHIPEGIQREFYGPEINGLTFFLTVQSGVFMPEFAALE